MGTPETKIKNRTETILLGYEILASSLTAEEWSEIVVGVLKICKPQLKYLSGFQTIEKMVMGMYFDNGEFPENIAEFPEGISKQDLVLQIAHIDGGEEWSPETPHQSRYGLPDLRWWEKLFLSRYTGYFIRWEYKYKRVKEPSKPRSVLKSETCKFLLLGEDELLKFLLGIKPEICKEILESLTVTVKKTIREREGRLEASRTMEKELEGVCSRLGLFFG